MKRTLALVLSLASGLVLSAAAQTPAATPAGPSKIAVIAFRVAVAKTNEGQRNFADLQKKYEPKRQTLKAQSDEIDALKKKLQADGDKLSDAARATQAKTIDEKEKSLQRSAEDAQNEMNQEMQELYASLAQKVYDVLSTYSQQQGYTVVLDVAQEQNPVLWAANGTEITQAVIDAYNTKSGVPAPPAAPAAAPKAAAPKAPAAK